MSLLFKVGNFTKSVAAAPVSQAITGVGFQPKAVILFQGSNTTNQTWQNGSLGDNVSFFSAAAEAFALSEATGHNLATSDTASSMAAKAHRCVNRQGTLSNECDLTSFDSDGFTVNWTTNDANAQIIFYIAIGGSEIKAKAHTWAMPTSAGNKAVTGVGFSPDLVLFLWAQEGQTSLPYAGGSSRLRLGVMDRAGNQWAISVASNDPNNPSDSERIQLTDSCVLGTDTNTTRVKAAFVSMDADGYTVNFSTAPATAGIVAALALANMAVRVGTFAKPTGGAPAAGAVTGVGFKPIGLILAGVQNTGSGAINTHMELGLGAASSTSARGAVARIDRDNVSPTIAHRYSDNVKAYIKADNATPAVDAAADLASFDQDGFTLTWSPNDAVATVVAFIALGDHVRPRPARPTIRPRGANTGRQQRGAWRRRSG